MPDPTNANQPQELETVKSEKFFKFYTNAANLEMTPWDFTLLFGELKKSGDRMTIEHSVGIAMSPQHAKALAGILLTQVKEYEKQIGEIKLPPPPAQQAASAPEPKPPAATAGFKTN
jgi:hypothetical protein